MFPESKMAGRYVGAIDQGTTSTRFILFSKRGDVVSSAQKPFKQWLPEEGRTEHDALEIWESVQWCVKQALSPDNANNNTGKLHKLHTLSSSHDTRRGGSCIGS